MVDSAETLFNDSQTCERQENWTDAEERYRAALAERPDFVEAQHIIEAATELAGKS